MTDGDAKRPGESTDDVSERKPGTPVRSHVDMGVRVSRDLNANGPAARGYNAGMSKLNFSSRGMPRDEALVVAEDPAPAQPSAPPVPPPSPAAKEGEGVISWLTGLFTRR